MPVLFSSRSFARTSMMPRNLVLTVTGSDRVGMVEEVAGLVAARGGNVEVSRMARLGGEFAILMLVAVPDDRLSDLEADLAHLADRGYKVTSTHPRPGASAHPDWRRFRIAVQGADHEGIIQEVARYLSQLGINIESADSETIPAPISGVPLFTMTAEVAVPPATEGPEDWESGLRELAAHLNLEVDVESVGR